VRVCPQCGVSNQDADEFCGNCGTYLGQLPDAGAPGPQRPTAADGRPTSTPRPTTQRRAAAATYGPPTTAGPTAAAAGPTSTTDPGATTSPPTTANPDADPPADQPRAVQPGKPVARRPQPGPPAATPAQSGAPCPNCGTLNPPDRRFCRHCGIPLTEPAPAAGSPPWWRRIRLRRWIRLPAGSRWIRRTVALVVLAALAVAGVMLAPAGRGLIEDGRDKLATPQPLSPSRVTASAAVPGHPAAAAVDGVTNRYWGAPKLGDSIDFTFPRPFRLLAIVIHPGASINPDAYGAQARPSELDVVVTSSGGKTRDLHISLADRPGPQQTDTGISEVVRIRFVVRAAAGLSRGRHIALGEVEFFRR
jgi:zinc-ribbon domain